LIFYLFFCAVCVSKKKKSENVVNCALYYMGRKEERERERERGREREEERGREK
jgi:hypothetical protein